MKTAKRLLATIIALVMIITVALPQTAQAAKKKQPSLAKTKATLTVGKSTQLKVKNAPKGVKITYASSKKAVATVTGKGKVTAKKKGKATITVTLKKKGYKKALKFSLTVKDKAKPAPVPPAPEKAEDDYFVSGYPKLTPSLKEGYAPEYKVEYKLNPKAFKGDFVRLYYVITTKNVNAEATSEGVRQGYLGKKDEAIPVSRHGEFDVNKDKPEGEATISIIQDDNTDGVVAYFVVVDEAAGYKISAKPYKVSKDKKTVDTEMQFKSIEADYDAYINSAGNTISLYYKADLDTTSVPDPSDFRLYYYNYQTWDDVSVEKTEAAKVTKVTVHDDHYAASGKSYVTLELDDSVILGPNISQEYRLTYTPSSAPLKSTAGMVSEGFGLDHAKSVYRGVSENDINSEHYIQDVVASPDYKYVSFDIPFSDARSDADIIVEVNGTPATRENVRYDSALDRWYVSGLSGDKIISIKIYPSGSKHITDKAGDNYDIMVVGVGEIGTDREAAGPLIRTAVYSQANQTLTLTYDEYFNFGHALNEVPVLNFVIKKTDGSEERIKGSNDLAMTESNDSVVIRLEYPGIDLSDGLLDNAAAIKYSPVTTNGILRYDSGKPVPESDYVAITKV